MTAPSGDAPTRRDALLGAAGLAALLALRPAEAAAGEMTRFDAAAFDAALASGKPIFVTISAPWCPICKQQKPILAQLLAQPRFQALTVYEIDFDSGKADVRKLKATSQSTLLVYKGGKEVGRSVGETQVEWIEDLLDKAV